MDLIGQTIEARASVPKSCWFWLAVGALMMLVAVGTANIHWAIAAAFPFALALIIWLRLPRRVLLQVESAGLRRLDTGESFPYDSLLSVTVNGTHWDAPANVAPSAPMIIRHAGGRLVLPPRMSAAPGELYNFLLQRIRPKSRECPPLLADYVAQSATAFGPGKIEVIYARRDAIGGRGVQGFINLALAMLAAAGVWILASIVGENWFQTRDERDGWMIAGLTTLVLGLPMWILAGLSMTSRSVRKAAKGACIVLTPAGLAMVQGDLQGSLRWNEVLKVTHSNRLHAVAIQVPGSQLLVLDVYERSLEEIAMMMRKRCD
jgi:hypothetical protein